ncbi:hypothetical protein F1640_18510 [Novosphingobium sp. NBM11]|uniref:hypothetical protein n=1 Tax=Novosphingobium sp. NBM11 TaxID=2596914 RepID=UPI00189280A8|nr:hypothetical protein [Novosphingobium sp. NBM11]MBF5091949.1 hypothetical protein [Novosphingobium sp. NBM11]
MEDEEVWHVGEVRIQTPKGPRVIAGWLWKCWGLDFRVYADDDDVLQPGWSITHLPSGMAAGAVMEDLRTAQQIVAEYDAIGNWNFPGIKPPANISKGVKALREKYGDVLRFQPAHYHSLFTYVGSSDA